MLYPDLMDDVITMVNPFTFPLLCVEIVHFVAGMHDCCEVIQKAQNRQRKKNILIDMRYMYESSVFE